MSESVYKIIELVGTSTKSWEDAAGNAIRKASETLRDLRIAEVSQMDLIIKDGKGPERSHARAADHQARR